MANLGDIGLFFIATTQYGDSRRGWWRIIVEDICAALGEMGTVCLPYDPHDLDALKFLLMAERAGQYPRFGVSFNFRPSFNGPGPIAGWRTVPYPLFFPLLDHPVHLATEIAEAEAGIKDAPRLAGMRSYGIMEEGHRSFLTDKGIPDERVFLFPQGGPPPSPDALPFAERPLDVIFAGSIEAFPPRAEFLSALDLADPTLAAGVDHALEAALDGDEDVYRTVSQVFAEPIAVGRVLAATLTAQIDRRARVVRRHRLLGSLVGVPVRVYGEVAEDFGGRFPHVEVAPSLPFDELMTVCGQAKVVVNDTINLRRSALFRLFYSMAAGALVATETNPFITDSFTPGVHVAGLAPGQAGQGAMLTELLADGPRAQDMIDSARERYAQGHLWRHRLGALQAAMAAI